MTEFEKNHSDETPKKKRRQRYSGTHPKKFQQKYKEHNITKFPEMRKHLRAKGKTPAGTHVPIMVSEVIASLKPLPGKIVADCTLGYGGHAVEFIKRISPEGKFIGFDVDGAELGKTQKRLISCKQDVDMSFCHSNFAGIAAAMNREKIDGYDIIFADIGVSSMQIDNPERGISYKHDGPLDMRMDSRIKSTGADLINSISEEKLSAALWELSDEPLHEKIAQLIVAQRAVEPIKTVGQLVRLIFAANGLTANSWKKKQKTAKFGSLHPAARTFQTLRIMVNDELSSLRELLRVGPACLRPNGRIGIISFHSGEDRLVKKAFRDGLKEGVYQSVSQSPITPRFKEISSNPRSASAKFRWAVKTSV